MCFLRDVDVIFFSNFEDGGSYLYRSLQNFATDLKRKICNDFVTNSIYDEFVSLLRQNYNENIHRK